LWCHCDKGAERSLQKWWSAKLGRGSYNLVPRGVEKKMKQRKKGGGETCVGKSKQTFLTRKQLEWGEVQEDS